VLAVLFALAITYRVRALVDVARELLLPDRTADNPLLIEGSSNRVEDVPEAARQAGVVEGDLLLRVDDAPYTGRAVLAGAVARSKPGDVLRLELQSGGAAGRRVSVVLTSLRARPVALALALSVFTPVVCLVLGFGVVALRLRDPRAWSLLLLLVGFSHVVSSRGLDPARWEDGLRQFGMFWHGFFATAWALGMLLFGLSFPDRLALERRHPWLKWLLIAPLLLHSVAFGTLLLLQSEDFVAGRALGLALARARPIPDVLQMLGIGAFFANLGFRAGTAASPDVKRRLRLLQWGASLGLMPVWVLVLYALFTRQPIGEGIPEPLMAAALLLLPIFPLTLAYVIVVERALDVRAVVRQGLQYVLARRGVAFLQLVVSAGVVLLVWMLVRDPGVNRPQSLRYLAAGVLFVALANRAAARTSLWIDRRFFREAVNAERLLAELSEEVRTIVETDKLLETVTGRLSEALHVPRVAVLVGTAEGLSLAHAIGVPDAKPPALPMDGAIARRLRETRPSQAVYVDGVAGWASQAELTDAERSLLKALQSQLLLPLAGKSELIGVLSLGPKLSEEPYSPADIRLLRSVAAQTALGLENSRLAAAIAAEQARAARMNREIEIAKEVQERLFPQSYPEIPGVELAGRCRPAAGVGGDYYDFLALKDGLLGIAVGDVSGKGIPAALLMAGLQASLRGQTLSGTSSLATLMANVNALLLDASPANRYATFFYGQYDPRTRRLLYVNAGHNAPMLLRGPGEAPQRLAEGGPVVGLLQPAAYQEGQITLEPGDLLVGFTDGISECMSTADEEWGEPRLIETLRACRDRPAHAVIDQVMGAADAFASGAKQHDDMTLVVMRVLDAP
jgi:sigma-B regulation protein RsbU (phosphoserine phosphatase)